MINDNRAPGDESPVESGPALSRRVVHIGVCLAFVSGIIYLITIWLFPTLPIRAYADVPEVEIRAPVRGQCELRVSVGQCVTKNDVVAAVRLNSAESQRRHMEMSFLRAGIRALAAQQTKVNRRMAALRRCRQVLSEARASGDLTRVRFEAAGDGAEIDFAGQITLAQSSAELATDLYRQTEDLFASGSATLEEQRDMKIWELSHHSSAAAIEQNQDRAMWLLATSETLSRSIRQAAIAVFDIPTSDEIQEARTLERLQADLAMRRAQLEALEQLKNEYVLRAPNSGIVVSVCSATKATVGKPVVMITNPAQALLSLRVSTDKGTGLIVPGTSFRFRVIRTGMEGEARIIGTRRGLTEHDRSLNRIEVFELMAAPVEPLSEIAPGEVVEVIQ